MAHRLVDLRIPTTQRGSITTPCGRPMDLAVLWPHTLWSLELRRDTTQTFPWAHRRSPGCRAAAERIQRWFLAWAIQWSGRVWPSCWWGRFDQDLSIAVEDRD